MGLEERQKNNALLARELAAFLVFGGPAALTNRGLFPALPTRA
jgi:hypothetical protein